MDVRPLRPDEWQTKRQLRLAALLDSPAAYASTHRREVGRSQAEWSVWPQAGQCFAAFDGAEAVGIAAAWVAVATPDVTHLIGMWVCPPARGRGVAGRLVAAVAGWARERGADAVHLEVAAGNDPALRAYLRAGFEPIDEEPFTTGGTVLRLELAALR